MQRHERVLGNRVQTEPCRLQINAGRSNVHPRKTIAPANTAVELAIELNQWQFRSWGDSNEDARGGNGMSAVPRLPSHSRHWASKAGQLWQASSITILDLSEPGVQRLEELQRT